MEKQLRTDYAKYGLTLSSLEIQSSLLLETYIFLTTGSISSLLKDWYCENLLEKINYKSIEATYKYHRNHLDVALTIEEHAQDWLIQTLKLQYPNFIDTSLDDKESLRFVSVSLLMLAINYRHIDTLDLVTKEVTGTDNLRNVFRYLMDNLLIASGMLLGYWQSNDQRLKEEINRLNRQREEEAEKDGTLRIRVENILKGIDTQDRPNASIARLIDNEYSRKFSTSPFQLTVSENQNHRERQICRKLKKWEILCEIN